MMRKLFVAVVVLALAAACLAAGPTVNKSEYSKTVQLSADSKVGDTMLKAGEYRVTHKMDGDNHVMVFQDKKGNEVAKAKCTIGQLEKKAPRTEMVYVTENGQRVLRSMTFRGDTIVHNF